VAFDQAAEYRFGLLSPAHHGEAIAGPKLKFGIAGIEARGALERDVRLRDPVQADVSKGEMGLVAGIIRPYRNGSPQVLDRSGRVTALQRDDPEQVHGVRMAGRECQDLLAGPPRLIDLPLLELLQPGFEQRSGSAGFSRGHEGGDYKTGER